MRPLQTGGAAFFDPIFVLQHPIALRWNRLKLGAPTAARNSLWSEQSGAKNQKALALLGTLADSFIGAQQKGASPV